ncbi:MAG: DUF4325 domain-containing protein [Pseudomonadota bacterium]
MTKVRARGEDIRKYILNNIEKHPNDIGKIAAEHFKISRQAINKHLQKLTLENSLAKSGNTKNTIYSLIAILEWRKVYKIVPGLAEDRIWREDIKEVLGNKPQNVLDIWHYGFTEMFNNVVDHSGGTEVVIYIRKTAKSVEMLMIDNGMGIFKKIQTAMNLLDERHALLELSKGKLTTDPKNHSGQEIFFTSRMFDSYDILSGGVYFSHKFGYPEDWILESDKIQSGTAVWMKLDNHTSRTERKIFDQYTLDDDYGFNKTVVPVRLAQYGNDKLVSRSQAKRVLARVELFKMVIFDFEDVEFIGQAFADEIFRVFATHHREVELKSVHENTEVKKMIERAKLGFTKEE